MVAEKYRVWLSSEDREQLERLIRSGQPSVRVIDRARASCSRPLQTELANNPGPNVSDWAGCLAVQISCQFDIAPEALISVAHIRHRDYEPDAVLPSDSFELVGMTLDPIRARFEYFSDPQQIVNFRNQDIALLREGDLPSAISDSFGGQ